MEHIKDTLNNLNLRRIEFEIPIHLELTGLELMTLIGNLILALKHPENINESSHLARDLGAYLACRILDECPSLFTCKDLVDEWKQELGFPEETPEIKIF